MREKRGAYRFLVGKTEGRRRLAIPTDRITLKWISKNGLN
jgi:hypothetical protein